MGQNHLSHTVCYQFTGYLENLHVIIYCRAGNDCEQNTWCGWRWWIDLSMVF